MNTLLLFVQPNTDEEDAVLERLGYKKGPEDKGGKNCRFIKAAPSLVPMALRDLARARITCPMIEIDMSWLTPDDWIEVDHDLIFGLQHRISPE